MQNAAGPSYSQGKTEFGKQSGGSPRMDLGAEELETEAGMAKTSPIGKSHVLSAFFLS